MIRLNPIGVVRSERTDIRDDNWGDVESVIDLREDLPDEESVIAGTRHPRNNPEWPKVGIFAQRARRRPSRLGVTTVAVLGRPCGSLRGRTN